MNNKNSLPSPSSRTPDSSGLASSLAQAISEMPEYQASLNKQKDFDQELSILKEKHQAELAAITEEAKLKVPGLVKSEMDKKALLDKREAVRYRIPYTMNNNTNPDRKIGADVNSSYLRRMAILYPIARACINFRIRQITQLEWDITTIDDIEGESGFDSQIQAVKEFFKHPMGHKTRLRKMLTTMVDDIMTIDATCFEISRLRGGDFDPDRGLKPVDPSTIVLLVDAQGGTPEPPEPAYRQVINNAILGEFTTDDLVYETMSARSYNPYGIAPLESLILQAESAMRGTLYNLNYFRESSVPEGFLTLPEDAAANKDQVEEWQVWFDAVMAGDPRMMRRLKILPYGSQYTPAKKPEDMSFEKFEMWLLEQTCAMFEVQPQDIGITLNVNRATAKSQQDVGRERGKIPLANFLKEFFDDIIQTEIGFEGLQWLWRNLNPTDKKQEAETNDIMWKDGILSTDDWRINQGLPPIGLKETIMTPNGPVLAADVATGEFKLQGDLAPVKPLDPQDADDSTTLDPNDENPVDLNEKAEQKEIKAWRKAIYNDLERGRDLRTKFPTIKITKAVHDAIAEGLKGVSSRHQAKMLFDQFLDPEVKQSFQLLKLAETFRMIENSV